MMGRCLSYFLGAVVVVALAGCAQGPDRRCSSQGHTKGTANYDNCVEREYDEIYRRIDSNRYRPDR
jgi:hypothetical protein